MIRMSDHAEYELGFVDEVWTAEREMQSRARVEHDHSPVGVDRLRMRSRHTP